MDHIGTVNLQLGLMTNGKEYLKSGVDGISKIDAHMLGKKRREKKEMKEKRQEIELISPTGES